MNPVYYVSAALDIFCVLISFVLLIFLMTSEYKKTSLNRLFICIVVFSMVRYFCDTFTWLLIGNTASYSYIIHSVAEFLNYFFQYLLLGVYADYVLIYIGKKAAVPPIFARALYGMCGVAIAMLIISQFNHMYYYIDENNVYHRQNWFLLSQSFQFIGLFAHVGILIRYKKVFNKRELISLLTYLSLPILGTIAQGAFYGLPSGNVAIMIATLVIYMGIQSEQSILFKQQELELTNARIAVMLSQIQPHFLFNSLEAIRDLCKQEFAAQSEDAVKEFSKYLRGNLDSITYKRSIAFTKELEHTQIYCLYNGVKTLAFRRNL